ncbi:MAG: hypothetical protein ABIG31_01805 [Candidatus Omnitrophota bacterium]
MIFKEFIFISLLSHITLFSLFSLSFGNKIPVADYTAVSFLGQLLFSSQVEPGTLTLNGEEQDSGSLKTIFKRNSGKILLKENSKGIPYGFDYYFKPALEPGMTAPGKASMFLETVFTPPPLVRKDQTVIFHPILPYSFPLYFRDRQVAHVELIFKIAPAGPRDLVLIKRKISSGNLEVDLLSMRYIGRYLFIQQKGFVPTDWQTVKIDLSARQE